MAKTGDIVRYLNATGGGRIVRIEGQIAYVDEDGFETPILLRECVVVGNESVKPTTTTFKTISEKEQKAENKELSNNVFTPAQNPIELPIVETPTGEKLNLVIGFEPIDIKRLSETTFDAYLVNDSNYFIAYTIATRTDDDGDHWTLRASGIIEPNMQEFIFEVKRELIPQLDHIAFQYIAYKTHKPFALKTPQLIEKVFDPKKFFKLHCFGSNPYFDSQVLAVDMVRDDEPCIPRKQVMPDPDQLKAEMQRKMRLDKRPVRPIKPKKADRRGADGVIEVDLHINELLDDTRGLSNADMLNIQVDEFCRIMDANLINHGQRIVFIHGKGEGVLRQAIMKELNHRYKGHNVQDASFREYGFGATQVTIR